MARTARGGTVFVVGAGVSAGLGYPLTRDLLFRLIPRLNVLLKERLSKVIKFHHPTWDERPETVPDVEELLTELAANDDLLEELRPNGPFGPAELKRTTDDLLLEIARSFHSISEAKTDEHSALLNELVAAMRDHEHPTIISFNWDYELDKAISGGATSLGPTLKPLYGLESGPLQPLAILKPHGSLNWYLHKAARHIKEDLIAELWSSSLSDTGGAVDCFVRWREPKTLSGRQYIPWIVPPTHMKSFRHPMLRRIWSRCVEALSTARRVYFLGYSLPLPDWHARYIIRCGFHNQIEGLPKTKSGRAEPTGRARVVVVNPDNSSFRRIESVVGAQCHWFSGTVAEWLSHRDRLK